jgi:multidrug resistance efflux pump
MSRKANAQRKAGQAARTLGGPQAVGVPARSASGEAAHENRDSNQPVAKSSIFEDADRAQALAAELVKLDAGRRLDYLRKALDDPAIPQAAPAIEDREDAGRSAESPAEGAWLYRQTVRTVRGVSKAPGVIREQLYEFFQSTMFRRLLKTALGLALVIVVGWGPAQRLMQTTSVDAVVNARLVTLRTPIEGEIAGAETGLAVGARVAPGTPLLRIVNRRADRTRLDELRRRIESLEYERPVLVAKLEAARALHAEFVEQTRQFQEGRIKQLEARLAEIRSEISVALTRREDAAETLGRAQTLAAKGFQTRVALDRARREEEIAGQLITAAQQRARTVEVELEAARAGTFVGDSYNDRPRSSQRADELQQQVTELAAELRQRDARAALLNTELVAEQKRFADLADVTISAPSSGTLWEVLTAAGEQVNRGQELVRMLDCSTAVVTATVSESVYNRLHVGAPARFRFRDGGAELEGHVVHLTGMAEAPANLAIAPSSLIRESYRVTVAIPELANSPICYLGRTGRVVFGDAGSGAAVAAIRR